MIEILYIMVMVVNIRRNICQNTVNYIPKNRDFTVSYTYINLIFKFFLAKGMLGSLQNHGVDLRNKVRANLQEDIHNYTIKLA